MPTSSRSPALSPAGREPALSEPRAERVGVEWGSRAGCRDTSRENPFEWHLRAGSSLRLTYGCAQDDVIQESVNSNSTTSASSWSLPSTAHYGSFALSISMYSLFR